MSALDIYTTTNDKQLNYYKRYRDNHQRLTTSLYNKWNTAKSTTSTSTHSHSYVTITSRSSSSSSSSSFELLFSKLLDALIFTSAIAITAYSFLTGTLIEPTRPNTITHAVVSNSGSSIPSKPRYESSSRYQRRRTQEWAEQQLLTSASFGVKKRSCSTSKVQPDTMTMMKREKKRTQSLPVNKLEQEDELITRMEERLQSLIQQGQEALSSNIKYVIEN